jgi:signal recognition particle receptor subunit beta
LSFLNYSTREINFKVVYYGPALAGKTMNIKTIYGKVSADNKGKLVSLETETGRTVTFDFFQLDLGTIKGYKVKFHLYSGPGAIYYSSTRRLIMKGVDGIVFVADSQEQRFDANIESMIELRDQLDYYKIDFETLPYVLQLNKFDLPNIVPTNELMVALRKKREPVIQAMALRGDGVVETLKAISKLIMTDVKRKLK